MMVKSNNFESIRRLLVLIFLFSGIMECTLGPCRVFASESKYPAVILSDEEIATFDEDEETATLDEHEETASFDATEVAAFGSEPEEIVFPLLHAEHYQPSVYLPDRQKRYLTFHSWMRIFPFALLVILALTTTRFFGKRRRKPVLAEKGPSSGKMTICICVGIFLTITITVGVTKGQISYGIKDAVVSLLGEGRRLYQRSMELTPEVKEILFDEVWWEPEGSSIKFYYSKTAEGTVDAYAFVLSDILLKCGGVHKYCIKVSSNGEVEGIKVLNLTCPYSFPINNEHFLNSLKLLNTTNAETEHIDAVSGATTSSKLSVMIVRRALVLFELLEGNVDG